MEVHLLGLEWRGNEVTLPSISRGGTLALDPDYDDDDNRYDDNEDPWFLKPGGPRGPNFLAGALWALHWPFMLDFLLALSLSVLRQSALRDGDQMCFHCCLPSATELLPCMRSFSC